MEINNYCPIEVFQNIQSILLKKMIEACAELSVPRLSLAFYDENGHFDFNRVIHTDPDLKFQKSSINEGVLGLTVRRGEIVIYPHYPEAKKNFLSVDDRTRFEIAGPILYKNSACAALFSDLFDDEEQFHPNEIETFRIKFHEILEPLSDIVETGRKEVITQNIKNKLEKLRLSTASIRGYVAIKDWDSALHLTKTGENPEFFRDLSESEGICGQVFRSGRRIYIKDTSAPPRAAKYGEPFLRYISSDPNIRSEIVLPFKEGENVIAILNLESVHVDNFRRRFKEIEAVRDEIHSVVAEFREPLDSKQIGPEFILGRALHDLDANFLDRSIEAPEIDPIRDSARISKLELTQLFSETEIIGPFFNTDSLIKIGFPELSWEDRFNRPPWRSKEKWNYVFDLRIKGNREAIFVLRQENSFTNSALSNINRLARLASVRASNWRIAASQHGLISFLEKLLNDQIDNALNALPKFARRHFDTDHATLFRAVELESGEISLFPIASTCEELDYANSERYYKVDVRDGLTGFSATKRFPFVISRFKDDNDLKKLGKYPRCKSKIVETRSKMPQAFAAVQFFSKGKICYILRLSKILRTSATGFSEDDVRSMKRLQRIVELRLGESVNS